MDIVDILEHLGKADNIPFNQLYYITENCADRYYTKVIETLVSILKRQFADCQLLLVNTACCLKFWKSKQTANHKFGRFFKSTKQYWKTCKTYISILMTKNSIEKDFKFLKEATLRNVENFQTSLNFQQTYSSSLCSHVNIYSKLLELQRQIQNHHTHMNQGDTVQIEAPDFDPDIDGVPLLALMKYQTNY